MSEERKPILIVTFVVEGAEHDQVDWHALEEDLSEHYFDFLDKAPVKIINILQAENVQLITRVGIHYEKGKGITVTEE